MTKRASLILAASFVLTASAAASAADGDVTLRVDRGGVMTSQGGEFASAQTGKALVEGDRLMVTEGSTATLFYDNDCRREYTVPGVYVVEGTCRMAAVVAGTAGDAGAGAGTSTGTAWGSAAAIAAGVAVGAALLENMEQVPGPPVSR